MAYCGIKCYYRINCLVRTTTQSNHHKNLHSQFLKALIVETLVPVFLMHFPAAIAYLSCFLNMSSEVYGNILTMSIALFPAVDPLPTMIIVSSYRNAILKFVANPFKNFDFIQKLVEAIKIHVDADDTEMDVL
uniref:G_PROTEIN_RECEP_F1_2 domain-containing protein n=1 Tax=Caenorhabditis tropicalis TaxID=1561998 RepID=A0A1I7V0A8_9PELO